MESKERIALIGFMGSGKSTIGRILAKRLGKSFIDLDEEIQKESGMSIRQLFVNFGEDHFRKLETIALKKAAEMNQVVVSCGGGIVEKSENLRILNENFFVVFLDVPFEECYRRIYGDRSRPKLDTDVEQLKNLFNRRKKLYLNAADVVYKPEKETEQSTAENIARVILEFDQL
ncbi:MAG: shikimate kinase [Actinobacteria bacterium]|nr:shikimate kinase [Actinomycetota bacterium]